jgi:hypothetical protein
LLSCDRRAAVGVPTTRASELEHTHASHAHAHPHVPAAVAVAAATAGTIAGGTTAGSTPLLDTPIAGGTTEGRLPDLGADPPELCDDRNEYAHESRSNNNSPAGADGLPIRLPPDGPTQHDHHTQRHSFTPAPLHTRRRCSDGRRRRRQRGRRLVLAATAVALVARLCVQHGV